MARALRAGGPRADAPGDRRGRRRRRSIGARSAGASRGAPRCRQPAHRADLAGHQAEWVEPLRMPYRDGEAASLPPRRRASRPGDPRAPRRLRRPVPRRGGLCPPGRRGHQARFRGPRPLSHRPDGRPVPVERCLDRRARRQGTGAFRGGPPGRGGRGDGDTVAIVTADAAGNAVS